MCNRRSLHKSQSIEKDLDSVITFAERIFQPPTHFMDHLDLNKDQEITLDEYKIRLGIPFEGIDEIPRGKCFPNEGPLMTLFAKLDHNKDAHISKTELLEELRETGMEESQIQEVFANLDLDGDGLISLGEYKVALGLTYEGLEDWKQLFDEIDTDRSGDITVDELERLVKKDRLPITRSAITEWIQDHDRNNDGKLNFKEFLTFVGKQAERAFP
ncbi:hypothetical protein CRM22_006024 [Opisthorchis felineus]|uniref:EF-hand domain-containing protein n=1 Tax=Opisthorchis felineus TaxID=147828 RepID=A0A4S2LPP5_OPIFE|nr:hypothetical protein CRM22_006024 [Opisthorchis felineus]